MYSPAASAGDSSASDPAPLEVEGAEVVLPKPLAGHPSCARGASHHPSWDSPVPVPSLPWRGAGCGRGGCEAPLGEAEPKPSPGAGAVTRAMLSLKLPRLLSINQVPQGYREQGILFGYRPPSSSAAACVLSAFQMTNETLNIWTHFVPTWYFVWTLVGRLWGPGGREDPHSWPLLAYLLTCCVYPLASSCAHTFSTMSARARHLCYFCDYAALSMYSLGSALAYSAYIFPAEWVDSTFHRCYVPAAVFNSVVSTSLSCYSRFVEAERPRFSKACRTLAFAYPYLFDSIPLFYRFYLCAAQSCTEAAVPVHYKHTVLAFLTCFIFASHLPERLAPGHFDYIGHSHQVFHVCGILGTYFQLEAITVDMAERRGHLPSPSSPPSPLQTLGSMGVGVAASLAVIGLCAASLRFVPEPLQREKPHGQ